MTADQTSALVPRLRFPEFRDAGQWEPRRLERIGEFVGGGTPDTSVPEYWGGDIQWFTPTEIRDRNLSKSKRTISREGLNNSSAKLLPVGTLLITTRASIGDVGIADSPCTTNQGFQSLVVAESEVNAFWYYWLVRHSSMLTDRASGSTFLEIGKSEIKKILALRPDAKEQQKIADCLGSLDDLIVAEDRKLETLRQHKQGLMQQLFPQPGETVPRFRFPQFQNAPKWSFESIDEFAQTTTGKRDTQDKVDGGSYPFFVRSQSSERIDTYAYNGEAVLTSGDGVGVGKNFHYIDGKFDFHQRVYCIHQFKSHVLSRFFFFYFSERFGPRVRRMSAKNSVDSVRRSMITDMQVPLPDIAEQKTIADCLSAHDTLIDAQVAKLDTLQTHKQGLQQQLFPSLESQ